MNVQKEHKVSIQSNNKGNAVSKILIIATMILQIYSVITYMYDISVVDSSTIISNQNIGSLMFKHILRTIFIIILSIAFMRNKQVLSKPIVAFGVFMYLNPAKYSNLVAITMVMAGLAINKQE